MKTQRNILAVILIICFLIFALKRIYYGNTAPTEGYNGYLNNYQYQEQQSIFPAYNSPCKVAILGNSHAYKCHWDELLGMPVCNRGIGSDITEGMYARVGEIIRMRPTICFIESGANDIENGIPVDSTIKYFRLIIDTLVRHGITPVIMMVTLTSNLQFNKKKEVLNFRLRGLGAQNIQIQIEPEDLQPDGYHLTASAYLKWKEQMLPLIGDSNGDKLGQKPAH